MRKFRYPTLLLWNLNHTHPGCCQYKSVRTESVKTTLAFGEINQLQSLPVLHIHICSVVSVNPRCTSYSVHTMASLYFLGPLWSIFTVLIQQCKNQHTGCILTQNLKHNQPFVGFMQLQSFLYSETGPCFSLFCDVKYFCLFSVPDRHSLVVHCVHRFSLP